ncbi:MAG TPA: FhaA domain-containing protein [Iamia sp.]
MWHLVTLTGAAAAIAVLARHAAARLAAVSWRDTAVHLHRRAWPTIHISLGQLEKRILGRMLACLSPGVSGRVLVPRCYTVHVSEADHAVLGDVIPLVIDHLRAELEARAEAKGWVVPSTPRITIVVDPDGHDGAPRVEASFARDGSGSPAAGLAPTKVFGHGQTSHGRRPTQYATQPMSASELGLPDGTSIMLPASSTRLVLGRSTTADVVLDGATVSARHAEVVREGSTWRVVDLGSTNGTYLNGAKILPGQASAPVLRHGDQIRLGRRGPLCSFQRMAPDTPLRRRPATASPKDC